MIEVILLKALTGRGGRNVSKRRPIITTISSAVVACLLFMSYASSQEILRGPENVTAILDQMAQFSCITRGGAMSWLRNNTLIEELPSEEEAKLEYDGENIGNGRRFNYLRLQARDNDNFTMFQCVVRGIQTIFSNIAVLYVQGPLSAVGDLTASYSSSSVTVNWTAPFSLDVTGVDHDIWYSVIIYNVTDENNSTVINCTDCINITDTYYIFTPNYPGLCQSFNFSIIPMNGAGQGERSPNDTGFILNVDKPHLTAISSNESQATFKMGHSANRCKVDINPVPTVHDTPERDEISITYNLTSNEEYTFNITIFIDDVMVLESPINFTTFDVQDANTTSGENNISMTGQFMENTKARGCFIVLQQCHVDEADDFRVLPRPNDNITVISILTNLAPSNYILFVHDLERNGMPYNNNTALKSGEMVVSGEVSVSTATSAVLDNANININGTSVFISCKFKVSEAACVLVYRECNSITIHVKEYHHQNTTFPVTLNIDDPLLYTFAIFGKTGSKFDERPLITKRMQESTSTSTPPLTVVTSRPDDSDNDPVAVVVGVTVVIVTSTTVTTTIVVVLLFMRKRKSVVPCSKQVPEDEVISSSYSSGSLKSQPNPPCLSITSQGSTAPLIAEDGGRKVKEEEREESKYATLDTKPSGVKPPPLPLDTGVKYEQIDLRATQKLARAQYAEVGPRPSNAPMTMPHIPNIYVEVRPQAQVPVIAPPTVETVMSKLYDKSNEWKEIAEMMEFDEDLIDEIDTNNDADVTSLQVCVEMWVSKFNPTWDHVSLILSQLRERNGERALQEVMKSYN